MRTLSAIAGLLGAAMLCAGAAGGAESAKPGWLPDLKQGFIQAKSEKRFLVAFFSAPGSASCDRMWENTFCLSPVVKALEDFSKVRVDVKASRGYALLYKVQQTPTVIYFDSEGRELDRFGGYADFETFLRRTIEAVDDKTNYVKLKDRLRTRPDDVNALYHMGFKYTRRKDFDRAAQYFALVEKYDKDDRLRLADNIRLRRAEDLEQRGDAAEGLKLLDGFARKYPDSDEADFAEILRARLLLQTGKTAEAAQAYERVLKEFPDSLHTSAARGALQALRQTKKSEK